MRDKPCICVSCSECGAVFFASAIREDYLTDREDNTEMLKEVAGYFKEGYDIAVKDASNFEMDYCEHLKNKR